MNCYLPNGEKCPKEISKAKTLHELNNYFEEKGRAWNTSTDLDEDAMIAFKSFTLTPLYIIFTNKKDYSSEKINDLINSINKDNSGYNYYFGSHQYGHHWGVKADIERFIKQKSLDEKFLIETLGTPSEVKDSYYGGKPAKCYIYLKEGVRIYYINGIAIGYDKVEKLENDSKVIDVNDTDIYDTVDQQAIFGGGIDKFRNLFNSSFDNSSVKDEGTLKTTVTFIVEKDGSISNVIASGPDYNFNREAERTIKSIKGKWVPAKINGYPVRSRFRFPVTINI
ncbi:energy transducer TonB [Elizabethkingia meningoseptica]|uniref:energy transducer TonB n=1 Tax=Elizabethkingia meningoseptica TaxID=238 RepID=UPI0021A5FAA0|nr:energy transducer TonB [Elizabethkingia meningoseptica]